MVRAMSLERLVYYSCPRPDLSHVDVASILEKARTRNAELGVTGALGFRADLFVQVLEGERETIAALYEMICADPRHTTPRLIGLAPIESRQFATWSMDYMALHQANRDLILKHSGSYPFDPAKLTAAQVTAILRTINSGADESLRPSPASAA